MTMTERLDSHARERADSTRRLLTGGAVAGPLFVAVALAQAYTRTGFDPSRHPFSMLSLGDLGWIQITNFVLSGLLFAAAAVGLRRRLGSGPGAVAGPVLYGLFGLSQVGGGVFVADPALGFPVGAAEGPPESISWHGGLHGVAFAIGMSSLIGAFVVLARRFAAEGARAWVRGTALTGVAFLLLGGLGAGLGDWRLVAVAIVLGWGWASLVAARYRRPAAVVR